MPASVSLHKRILRGSACDPEATKSWRLACDCILLLELSQVLCKAVAGTSLSCSPELAAVRGQCIVRLEQLSMLLQEGVQVWAANLHAETEVTPEIMSV